MNAFNLRILEANSIFYEGQCDSLSVPCVDGMYGILANHANTVLAMNGGRLKYHIPEDNIYVEALIEPGMVKIEDNDVLVLTHSASNTQQFDFNGNDTGDPIL